MKAKSICDWITNMQDGNNAKERKKKYFNRENAIRISNYFIFLISRGKLGSC